MAEADVIISGGLVVVSAEGPFYSPGYVAVESGEITEVGPGKPKGLTAQNKIEAQDSVIIPGLVSAHDHMYGVLAHGIPVKAKLSGFWDFLDRFWWPYVENRLDKSLVEAAVRYAVVERLKTGTTLTADILEAPNAIPGVLDVEADVLESAGLRGVLSFEATERIGPENGLLGLSENSDFIKRRNKRNGLVKGMHCIHTTFTCSPEVIKKCRAEADESKAGIHIHFEEGSYESEQSIRRYGKLPAFVYEELGFWGPDVIASQCVKTTLEELDVLARHGVRVSHQPLSNGEVGGGIAPVPEMLERGITVCLGTDGFVVDMFEVMRNTWLIHKAAKENASVMPAETVFRMATENGARALGVNAGKLVKGYKADITVVKNKFPTPLTVDNVVSQLVVYCSGTWVDTVVVEGKVVVENGKILTVNEQEAKKDCFKAAEKLWAGVADEGRN
ncbi:MAG: amidohydrolase family protein [Candidatus Caldarchaeum sp.]|nr:amidohydrolase family protein [Candidatus Caldarchaeum sp.]MDW7978005.1 amidohydrolase family protein [Candidatus Caldarchaeum sp.]MDW8359133.1 amidohydrolase family protein [Candidatus Caldarchaeum sp.]